MRIELLKFLEWYHERMDMPLEDNEIIYVDEYLAQKQTEVNKLALGDVSNRRELLIAFADAINVCDGDKRKIRKLVDIYLKSK